MVSELLQQVGSYPHARDCKTLERSARTAMRI